jgi:hypothetical protein
MRAWLHIGLTLVFTIISTVAAIFFALLAAFRFDEYCVTQGWPRWWAYGVWMLPFVGLQISGLLMSWIPCVCPRCGSKAHLEAHGIFMNFAPLRGIGGHWAWTCEECNWTTSPWSALYKGQTV